MKAQSHGCYPRIMRYLYIFMALQLVILLNSFLQLPSVGDKVLLTTSTSSHYTTQRFSDERQGHNFLRSSLSAPASPTARVAILMAYTGTHLPPWFSAFAASCRSSSSIADWLIFHDGVRLPDSLALPTNVALIDLGPEGLAERLASVIPTGKGGQAVEAKARRDLHKKVRDALTRAPYMLIQFKPALGYIFRDYLGSYSHWAFADLDVLMGDLGRFVGAAELQHYDAITFSFGDQFRAYTRGQLTIMKKEKWSLEGFRACPYLSPAHLLQVLRSSNPREASTEGCFSHVISTSKNLRVLYMLGLFSDANLPEDDYRDDGPTVPPTDAGFYEALVLNDGRVIRCGNKNQLIEDCLAAVLSVSPTPSMGKAGPIADPRQVAKGFHQVRVREENTPSSACMWWVEHRYQLCLRDTGSHDDIYRSGGRFYSKPLGSLSHRGGRFPHWLPGTVEASMMHFQEWKKAFPYWAVPSAGPGYAGTLVTDVGFLPVPLPPTPQPTSAAALDEALADRGGASGPGRYCTAFDSKQQAQEAPRCVEWAYRAQTVRIGDDVLATTTTSPALLGDDQKRNEASMMTLVMLSRGPHDIPLVMDNALLWPGPKLLVAYIQPGSSKGGLPLAYTNNITVPMIVVPFHPSSSKGAVFPIKAMMNAGMDAVQTRYMLALDPARQRLAPDTYQKLRHATSSLADRQGVVIVLPEMASNSEDALSASAAGREGVLGCGGHEEGLLSLPPEALKLWRQGEEDGGAAAATREGGGGRRRQVVVSVDDLLVEPHDRKQQLRVVDLMPEAAVTDTTNNNNHEGKHHHQPQQQQQQEGHEEGGKDGAAAVGGMAVLLDLMGPQGPLYLRWLEELGGYGCSDLAFLLAALRMLDYHAFIAPGAFITNPTRSISDAARREYVSPLMECGCAAKDVIPTLKLFVKRLARHQNLNRAVQYNSRALDRAVAAAAQAASAPS